MNTGFATTSCETTATTTKMADTNTTDQVETCVHTLPEYGFVFREPQETIFFGILLGMVVFAFFAWYFKGKRI